MSDNKVDALVNAYQAGVISAKTLTETIGLDYDKEVEWLQQQQIDEAKEAKKKQEKLDEIKMAYACAFQLAQKQMLDTDEVDKQVDYWMSNNCTPQQIKTQTSMILKLADQQTPITFSQIEQVKKAVGTPREYNAIGRKIKFVRVKDFDMFWGYMDSDL